MRERRDVGDPTSARGAPRPPTGPQSRESRCWPSSPPRPAHRHERDRLHHGADQQSRRLRLPRIAGRTTLFPAERTKQGRSLSALLSGETRCVSRHLHEDTPHTERTELVRDRAIRAAATSCCLRHRVTLSRVGLTVKSEAARVASIASSDGGMSVSRFSMLAVRLERTWHCSLCLAATGRRSCSDVIRPHSAGLVQFAANAWLERATAVWGRL